MRLPLNIGLAAALLVGASDAQAQMRFRGMDINGDGVITKDEWRGSDQSFRDEDWNGDNVLSGDEVRTGGRRQSRSTDWNDDGHFDNFDRQIAQRFRGYDMNGDDQITSREWPGDRRLFSRLDANRDGYLTMDEYISGRGYSLDALGGPTYGFGTLDANRDGWVTRNEWRMDGVEFDRLDRNRDNRINQSEFDAGGARLRPDAAYDNDDDRRSNRNGAWRSGYDRGILEGQSAGRGDFERNHGWDLEGQTELERADSGYSPQMGSLSDYQSGYREGFRFAYRMGFNNARDGR